MLLIASADLGRRTKRRGELDKSRILRFQCVFNVLVQLLVTTSSFGCVDIATTNDVEIGG